MIIALVSHSIAVGVFLLLGVIFSRGKGAFLIAGYNTAPREEKARYDEQALCRFMGKLMFALAECWCPVILGTALDLGWLLGIGIAAFLGVIFGGVIYANTGNRFRKRK